MFVYLYAYTLFIHLIFLSIHFFSQETLGMARTHRVTAVKTVCVSSVMLCQVSCQVPSNGPSQVISSVLCWSLLSVLCQVVSRVPSQVMSSVLCHVVKCCLSSSGKCPLLSSLKRRKKLCRVLCQVGQSVFPLGCIECSPSGSVKSSVSFVNNGGAACFPTFKTQHNLITSLKTRHWLQ